jgi:hypothetical protein
MWAQAIPLFDPCVYLRKTSVFIFYFNLILDSGKYPSNWRKSFIILIHKAGDKLDINNYRGISLQICIAKLFSAAINCRIVT